MLHIKPRHIVKDASKSHRPNEYTSADGFFTAAREVGFTHVFTLFRQNMLARELSSYELHLPFAVTQEDIDELREKHFLGIDLTQRFDSELKQFFACVEAARASGFTIVSFEFSDVIDDVCQSVDSILSIAFAADRVRALTSHCESTTRRHAHCDQVNEHTRVIDSHESPLEDRIGLKAAAYVSIPKRNGIRMDARPRPKPAAPLREHHLRCFSAKSAAIWRCAR